MKKIINFILTILVMTNLIFFVPNTSYGICNTFNFKKELSAVQLILPNGNILYNMKVDKNLDTQTQLSGDVYKDLNLVFLIEMRRRNLSE